MARPLDFIIIGAQKGGTTALYKYLCEQPAFSMSSVKEVHFFDDDSRNWSNPDYGPYHANFDPAGWGKIVGEATPIYCYWPNCLERIARYNPDVKLVYLLRDPVERAWSHWKMEYARKAELQDFSWSIREGRARLFSAEPWGFHREFSYVERGYYGEQVERLFGLFPREQILVARSDMLRDHPNGFLSELCAFLGAGQPIQVKPKQVHVAKDIDYGGELSAKDVELLRTLYAADAARLRALTGIEF